MARRSSFSTLEPPSFDAADRKAIDQALQTSVESGGIPAVAAVVVGPEGEIYKGAFGTLDVKGKVPATPDPIFRISWMTTPITSVAGMMLVQEKRVDLEASIDTYLGARERVLATFDPAAALVSTSPMTSDITVRQLLTNTSGMAYSFSNDVMHRVHEAASRIEETDVLIAEPGTVWTFGPGVKLVGEIVAKVSGRPLDVFLGQRIFEPLGMAATGFGVGAAARARVATSHQRRDAALVEQPNPATLASPVRGDTGLFSTASDYGRFLRMLLNEGEVDGRRLLERSTVRAMTSNQIGDLVVERQESFDAAVAKEVPRRAGRDAWGFGFQIARPETPGPQHPGVGSLIGSGVMNTYFWIDPAPRIGAVFMSQILPFGDEAATRALEGFQAAVYSGLA